MRKVTERAANALKDGRLYKSGNTQIIQVVGDGNRFKMLLHGNIIADYNHDDNTLWLNDCGWQTVTTKERLNGVLSVLNLPMHIGQHNFEWYVHHADTLVNSAWNGTMTVKV